MGFFKSFFGVEDEASKEKEPSKNKETDFETLKYDGVRARKMGELTYAIRCFCEALVLKEDLETTSYLAETYLQVNEPENAFPLLQVLVGRQPENITLLLTLSQTARFLEKWDTVLEMTQKVLAVEEKNTIAHYLQGIAYHAMNNDIAAIALLTQTLMQDPDFEQAYLSRARVLYGMGEYVEAEKDIDYLIGKDPSEEVLLLQGDIKKALADPEAAIAAYRQARDLNPFSHDAILKEGGVYVEIHQLDKALRLYDEAIDLQPDFSEAYKERGKVKNLLNDKNGAFDDLKRSIELAPDSGKDLDGDYTNIENRMEQMYKERNPYGF